MQLAWFLAARLLRRRGTALLRTSALAALLAVALGAASLVVVLALMSGYTGALRSGVLSAGGHLVALSPPGRSQGEVEAAAVRVAAVPGVAGVGEVVYLPGMMFPETAARQSWLPCGQARSFHRLCACRSRGRRDRSKWRWDVASPAALPSAAGDTLILQVVTGGTPRAVATRVGQVFSTGFAELDERFVVAELQQLRRRVPSLAGGGLEIWLADPEKADALRERVEKACGRGSIVATWQERNRNLFAALRWQKISLGVVLSLVLGVGAFEVASALVVLVTEKRREFGVLLAIGGQPSLLRRTLLLAGGALGTAGVLAGMLLGVALVLLLGFLGVPHFPPDIASIYMVETIPLRLLPGDLAVVLALSLVEVLLASLLPAHRASKREPVEVLRWV